MLGITDDDVHKTNRKRKKRGITFNEDEEVINPEDVDPSVGRFRNLVQTTVVPSKVNNNYLNFPLIWFFFFHLIIKMNFLANETGGRFDKYN